MNKSAYLQSEIDKFKLLLFEVKEQCYYKGKRRDVKRLNVKVGNLIKRKLYFDKH